MIILPPKEIEDKIKFIHNDVVAIDGVKISEDERKLLEQYRKVLKEENENRIERQKVTLMVTFMLEGGMNMASDDMFRIINCILKELYECKKKVAEVLKDIVPMIQNVQHENLRKKHNMQRTA